MNFGADQFPGDPKASGWESAISRRQAIAGGLSVAGAVLLAACGSSSSAGGSGGSGVASSSSSSAGTPKRGGTLKLGVIGQGTIEILAPATQGPPGIMRGEMLYDRLVDLGPDLKTLVPKLALSWESNKAATEWTFKLRPGVMFHNGKPLEAKDVAYTIASWGTKDSLTFGALNGLIDYDAVKADGKSTVVVKLLKPCIQFPSLLSVTPTYGIAPAGMTIKELSRKPIGTGPFKYQSFEPGTQSVFVANRDYFLHGGPYLDSVVVNSSFSDPNAMVNALQGGQLEGATQLPPLSAKELTGNSAVKLLNASSPNVQLIYMNTRAAPFTDPRVIKAFKLIPDRQALVDGALAGFGAPANDLLGEHCDYYDSSLKAGQDIAQAKSLLKAAGHEDLQITFSTGNAFPGAVQAATLFAQQAQAAGVKMRVNTISPANYFSYSSGYPYLLGQDYDQPQGSISGWYRQEYVQFNETRWQTPKDAALQAALTASQADAAEKWKAAQAEQFDKGGYIVWGNANLLDGISPSVQGVPASAVGPMNNYKFNDAWLS